MKLNALSTIVRLCLIAFKVFDCVRLAKVLGEITLTQSKSIEQLEFD